MEKPLNCELCGISLPNKVFYNLRKDYTKSSRTLLIDMLENCAKYLEKSTNLCCKTCYNLLNQLDELHYKASCIENKFLCYVEGKSKEISVFENVDIIENEADFDYGNLEPNDKLTIIEDEEVKIATPKSPFICEKCGKSFKEKTSLKTHLKLHNGEKPFQCDFCKKSFTQKCALVRHLPLHTGKKPHQCEVCGKCFIHHTSFNLHKMGHKGEKPFKCDVCGLALRSGSHLSRHKKTHTGEKKHKCEICFKSFAEKYNLSVHMKSCYAGNKLANLI